MPSMPTLTPSMPTLTPGMTMPELQPATIEEAPPSPPAVDVVASTPSQTPSAGFHNSPVSNMFPTSMSSATISQSPMFTPHPSFPTNPLINPYGATLTTADDSVKVEP